MEVRGGEHSPVEQPAVAQRAGSHPLEPLVVELPCAHLVQQAGEPVDGRGSHDATAPHCPTRMRERVPAIVAFGQVIERAEEQHDIR
jgi:hypothetical protein